MNGGMHISQEDLALYAMQALDGEELKALRAHLPTCAECREQLQVIAGDLTTLGLSVEQHPVPDAARQRFMESIAADSPVRGTATPIAITSEPARKRSSGVSWVPWAIAAALAIAVAGLGMKVRTLNEALHTQGSAVARATEENVHSQRVLKLLMAPSAQHVTLTTRKPSVEPTGHAIYLAERGELIFQGNNLKSLPEGKTYELWLIPADGRAPIPAGLFRPGKSGDASIVMPPLPAGVPAKAFGITIENADGASTPTMPIVLSGAPDTPGE